MFTKITKIILLFIKIIFLTLIFTSKTKSLIDLYNLLYFNIFYLKYFPINISR